MLKLYGDECFFHRTIYKCFEQFKEGREDLNNDERLGRPRSAANKGKVKMCVTS